LTLNKKQSKKKVFDFGNIIFLCIFPNFFITYQLLAQESYKLNEIEIDRTFNLEEEDNLDFPTNPFEIVDRLRRANSMNDATKPSDAIDEALKSFDIIKDEKQI
tara:strand:- start:343 stop:654 length:312 start_codon:yes stop_codon:yes gene_type:complete